MSTNIHFYATRKITFRKKNGKRSGAIQQISFERVWQTPTRVTLEIMKGDPIQGYKDWILNECSSDQMINVFADDDIFCENVPIGKEVYNPGKEHLAAFEEWLAMCDEEGYTVRAEAW